MRKYLNNSWVFLFANLLILFFAHIYFASLPVKEVQKVLLTPPQIKYFSFGQSEQLADNLWIRAIQDFDYCEKKISNGVCKNESWLYKMLDLIVDLSPHFRMPQATGPVALSVLTSDIEGASKLFDRAVQNFPNDWPILYRAAYHAMEEEKNYYKAAQLLDRAAKLGGPPWLYSLAGRLYTKEGQRDLAVNIYREVSRDPSLQWVAERLRNTIDKKYSQKDENSSSK